MQMANYPLMSPHAQHNRYMNHSVYSNEKDVDVLISNKYPGYCADLCYSLPLFRLGGSGPLGPENSRILMGYQLGLVCIFGCMIYGWC